MEEIWKDIENYIGLYQISNFGRVKSKKKIISKHITSSGYYRITLYNYGNKKHLKIHRLVAQAFILNPENKPQINHIDGDKLNNHVSNLEWCTAKENINHSFKIGLINQCGENNNANKLTNKEILEIRDLSGILTQTKIAEKYNITQAQVSHIINKKAWKHI